MYSQRVLNDVYMLPYLDLQHPRQLVQVFNRVWRENDISVEIRQTGCKQSHILTCWPFFFLNWWSGIYHVYLLFFKLS